MKQIDKTREAPRTYLLWNNEVGTHIAVNDYKIIWQFDVHGDAVLVTITRAVLS